MSWQAAGEQAIIPQVVNIVRMLLPSHLLATRSCIPNYLVLLPYCMTYQRMVSDGTIVPRCEANLLLIQLRKYLESNPSLARIWCIKEPHSERWTPSEESSHERLRNEHPFCTYGNRYTSPSQAHSILPSQWFLGPWLCGQSLHSTWTLTRFWHW